MKRKLLSVLLSTALVASLFAGCGATESAAPAETATEDTKEEEPVEEATVGEKPFEGRTISAMLLQSQNFDTLQNMFLKYEEETGVKVDAQVIPDEQFLNILQTRLATDELPDIMQYNVPHVYNVIDAEQYLYDFSGEEWVSRLVAPEISQLNGKQYTFPLKAQGGFQALIYNKDVFEANGLAIPESADDFATVCSTLKDAGVTPILVASDKWVPQIWTSAGFARSFGTEDAAKEMSEKLFSGEAEFNDYPNLAAVIDDLLSLNKAGYVNEDVATLTWDDAWVRLAAGEGAMLMGEAFMIGKNQDKFPDTSFGVFNYPGSYDTEDTLSGAKFTSSFCTSATSENIDIIKDMYAKFSTPEYGSLYFESGNAGFPAFPDINGGEVQADIIAVYEEYQEKGAVVSEMNGHWGAMESLYNDFLWTYYLDALINKDSSGAEILEKYQEDFNKFQKQNGVEGF